MKLRDLTFATMLIGAGATLCPSDHSQNPENEPKVHRSLDGNDENQDGKIDDTRSHIRRLTSFQAPSTAPSPPEDVIVLDFDEFSIKIPKASRDLSYQEVLKQKPDFPEMILWSWTPSKETPSEISIINFLWLIDKTSGQYKKIAEAITKDANTLEEKIKALVIWIQKNIGYLEDSEGNIAMDTLINRKGDCRDKFILLKTFAYALGLQDWVGMVISSKHIAPIIRIKSKSEKSDKEDASSWEFREIASPKGVVNEANKTNWSKIFGIFFPDGTKSVMPTTKVLEIVPEEDLDKKLVHDLQLAIAKLMLIIIPSNDPQYKDKKTNPEKAKQAMIDVLVAKDLLLSQGKISKNIWEFLENTYTIINVLLSSKDGSFILILPE